MDEASTIRADQDALERARNGDAAALGELYDRHARGMLGLARRFLDDPAEAQDLVHDVFVEAWQRAGAYRPERGSVRAWLLLRVRSRALDRLRHTRVRRTSAREVAEHTAPQPVRPPSGAVDGARARALLGALSTGQREVIELSYFGGLTCKEIAIQLGVPEGTVKARLSRAVSSLRVALRTAATTDT